MAGINFAWLAVWFLSQSLTGGMRVFPRSAYLTSCHTRVFPTSANLIQSSQSGLWCGRLTTKHSDPRVSACYVPWGTSSKAKTLGL
jgi:hypothetical protein